jgi:hypothetical protein
MSKSCATLEASIGYLLFGNRSFRVCLSFVGAEENPPGADAMSIKAKRLEDFGFLDLKQLMTLFTWHRNFCSPEWAGVLRNSTTRCGMRRRSHVEEIASPTPGQREVELSASEVRERRPRAVESESPKRGKQGIASSLRGLVLRNPPVSSPPFTIPAVVAETAELKRRKKLREWCFLAVKGCKDDRRSMGTLDSIAAPRWQMK